MKYRFSHRSADGKRYYWESVLPIPGDSRHDLVWCTVEYFWGTTRGRRGFLRRITAQQAGL